MFPSNSIVWDRELLQVADQGRQTHQALRYVVCLTLSRDEQSGSAPPPASWSVDPFILISHNLCYLATL